MAVPTMPRRVPQRVADGGRTVIWVGGVPGAGKSTLLREVTDPDVEVLDPEQVTDAIRTLTGDRLPYRAFRWATHLIHTLRVALHLFFGDQRTLLIHDTSTRSPRRRFLGRLARRLCWQPSLLLIDVGHDQALAGQHLRGRMTPSFESHWERWQQLRSTAALAKPLDGGVWHLVAVVPRSSARAELDAWLTGQHCEAVTH